MSNITEWSKVLDEPSSRKKRPNCPACPTWHVNSIGCDWPSVSRYGSVWKFLPRIPLYGRGLLPSSPSPAMARPNELLAPGLQPSLSAERDLLSEVGEFCKFIWEELKPFPGREHAVVRLVVSAVAAVLISETLRIPFPAYSAYLLFFVVNEDGVSSIKLGLLAMAGLTIALVAAMWVNICFMDAPWFRLPATFLLIAGTVWLSRTLVLAVIGRMMAVIFALYLSLADTIFDPESLTEATLWMWSIVGVTVGVSALVSVLLQPRPDLLLRAQIAVCLGSVQHSLESLASGRPDRLAEAKALRRQVYAAP